MTPPVFRCRRVPRMAAVLAATWLFAHAAAALDTYVNFETAPTRPVALWYRRSFPQPQMLEAVADVMVAELPNTVTPRRGL